MTDEREQQIEALCAARAVSDALTSHELMEHLYDGPVAAMLTEAERRAVDRARVEWRDFIVSNYQNGTVTSLAGVGVVPYEECWAEAKRQGAVEALRARGWSDEADLIELGHYGIDGKLVVRQRAGAGDEAEIADMLAEVEGPYYSGQG